MTSIPSIVFSDLPPWLQSPFDHLEGAIATAKPGDLSDFISALNMRCAAETDGTMVEYELCAGVAAAAMVQYQNIRILAAPVSFTSEMMSGIDSALDAIRGASAIDLEMALGKMAQPPLLDESLLSLGLRVAFVEAMRAQRAFRDGQEPPRVAANKSATNDAAARLRAGLN